MDRLNPPEPLQLQGNVTENFKRFKQAFEIFQVASGLEAKTGKIQGMTLLHVIGADAVEIYNTFTWTEAIRWRDRKNYPKSYDEFNMYVTKRKYPVTGELALSNACGALGRPYRYRGKNNIPELRQVLQGNNMVKVWVGAVDTTTPWVWTNGRRLYQLVGQVSSRQATVNAVTILGNNAFLCSLHCGQASFVLLQGNKCACSKTKPEMLRVSGDLTRCPGTYDEYCGTATTFTVYKSMLAKTVRWGKLVTKASYHGNKAYLTRPLQAHDLQTTLMAETDSSERMGYICNSTAYSSRTGHFKHLWVTHAQTAALTWRAALVACMNEGKQLMMVPRDAKDCARAVSEELIRGQSYWVGLTRQNVALWLDGTPVKTVVNGRQESHVTSCLTLTLTRSSPTFTFESCTGLRLPVLCERNKKTPQETFTHDANGNHIVTQRAANENDYSVTVSVLAGVLSVLSLLSLILILLLCNRDKWIPKRRHIVRRKPPLIKASMTSLTSISRYASNETSDISVIGTTEKDHASAQTVQFRSKSLSVHDALDYARSKKDERPSLITTGSDKLRPTSAGLDLTGMNLHSACRAAKSDIILSNASDLLPNRDETKRALSVRILDSRVDSSQSSAAGSEEAYSVINYRKAVQNAWNDVKPAAYAHVMVNGPMRSKSVEDGDGSRAYDVACVSSQRVQCIGNDYDHAEPTSVKSCSVGYVRDVRLMLEPPITCSESEV